MLDLRRQLEKQMLVNRVQQTEVIGKVSVSDDEVKAYYEANAASLATPANVTLREILVTVPTTEAGVNVAADEAAAAKAAEIHTRLLGRRAVCPPGRRPVGRAVEGQRRPARRDSYNEIAPELQKEIDALKPGDVTAPRRTSRGYQIIKLDARAGGGDADDGRGARPGLGARLRAEAPRSSSRSTSCSLRAQAIIEWKNDEVKKAYDAGLAASTAPAVPPAR